MKKVLGYFLMLAGAIAIIATLLVFGYLALIMVIWCPIQRCIPQFIVSLLMAGGAIALSIWVIGRGQKLIRSRKPL